MNSLVIIIVMNIKKLVLVSLISCLGLPSLAAASTFKIGNVALKATVDPVTTTIITGEDVTVALAGAKAGAGGAGSGMMTIIFKAAKSQIVKGAQFEITTGQDVQSGKVNVGFMYSSTATSGATTGLASDEESDVQTGKVIITKVDGDSFTATLSGKITNVLKTSSNPLKGQITPTESRVAGTNISAKFSGAL